MGEWEQREERSRRERETFRRLHRLVKKGYVVDWSVADVEDAFWLEHPGNGPRLILYEDGKIVSLDKATTLDATAKDDRDRICNEDKSDAALFDEWLRSVELPTWWQRTASDREKYVWIPGCMIMFFAILFGVGKLIQAAWNSLTGN